MRKKTVAIIGATSHIAKGLILNFISNGNCRLILFARSKEKIYDFLTVINANIDNQIRLEEGFANFSQGVYDVVINCIGVGTLRNISGKFYRYFTVTEQFDNLIIDYLRKNPNTIYISMSSGIVYGRHHLEPVDNHNQTKIPVNSVTPEDYYMIARLNAEAKHRSLSELKIVDLRIFSYFSRFINLEAGYFLSDVIDSVVNKKLLQTWDSHIIRDYIHPKDLFSLIVLILKKAAYNQAIDCYSRCPVEKSEILNYFEMNYNLKYNINKKSVNLSATGEKLVYFTINHSASTIGYFPEYSSMDAIIDESKYLLDR